MKSTFLKLQWRDLLKGFVVAVITSVVATLYTSFEQGSLPTLAELKTAGLVGIGAGIAYLIKNLFTDTVKEAETIVEQAKKEEVIDDNNGAPESVEQVGG